MKNFSRKETATKKGIASFLALLSFTAYMPVSSLPAFAQIAADTLPSLRDSVNGNVTTGDKRLDAHVKGGTGTVAQFDWNTFDVGKDSTVNFEFSANSQTALNRVLGGKMSEIYGQLTSSSANNCPSCVNTSKVILINPAGVLMGAGSKVNLNSFTASTYDIQGIKDLKTLTEAERKEYAGQGGATGGLFNLAGYNKTIKFVANDNMVDGNGKLVADGQGTRLASIVADGADIQANKTIAFVGNKIDVKNSKLTTTYESTPNAVNGTQTRSNIKLVTGDGVNFYYTSAGNVNNKVTVDSASKKHADQQYGINIEKSTLRSGNILAYNGVDGTNSSVKDSTLYSKKLLGSEYTDSATGKKYQPTETGTDGNLTITSKGTVDIEDSNIQTTNDAKNGENITTDIGYGNLTITGKRDVNIKNTQLRTADSKLNKAGKIDAGNITITSEEGDINLVQDAPTNSDLYKNTAVAAAGDLTLNAKKGSVSAKGYNKLQAQGHGTEHNASSYTDRSINVNAKNAKFEDTLLSAKNLTVDAEQNIDIKGTNVLADNTKLYGQNTTIDNSLMQYTDLSFVNPANSAKKNNVTVKNGSTFNDTDSDGLKLSTNGNLTIDNSRLKKQAYGDTTQTNQKSVELESTDGNVTLQNSARVFTSNGKFDVKANKGSITIDDNSVVYATNGDTNLSAKGDINVTNKSVAWSKNGNLNIKSAEGKVTAHDSKLASEGGNTTIEQAQSMNLDKDFKDSLIGATGHLTLKSNGDITGTTYQQGTGYINDDTDLLSLNNVKTGANVRMVYGDDATFDAGNDINITDLQSAKNVNFKAGNDVKLSSTTVMNLTNVKTQSGNNTNVAAAGRLTTDGFEILGGKKTTLSGDSVVTKADSVIKTNQNKLAVNAKGAIDIDVTGVTNAANGIDINADVNTSKGSDPLSGRTVKVEAKDGTLAVSKIKADTLDITADKVLKGDTTITAANDNVSGLVADNVSLDSKGYIEVKTEGGFNLDKSTKYGDSDRVGYNSTHNETVNDTVTRKYDENTVVDTKVEEGKDLVSSKEVQTDEVIGRQETSRRELSSTTSEPVREDNVTSEDGRRGYTETTTTTTEYEVTEDVTYKTQYQDTYQNTKTTTTTTKTTHKEDFQKDTKGNQHDVVIDEDQDFILVYGKTKSETGTREVSSDIKTDTVKENVGPQYTITDSTKTGSYTKSETRTETKTTTNKTFCEYEQPIEPDMGDLPELGGYDVASTVKNPRHAEGISNLAPIQNDLADTSSTVVAAAARLQLDEGDDESEEDNQDIEE